MTDLRYRTSSRCSDGCGGCCVEFAETQSGVSLRDTAGKTVTYTAQEWRAFVAGVKANEFNV